MATDQITDDVGKRTALHVCKREMLRQRVDVHPYEEAALHVCKREMLRPLRDQILRISGFEVDSTLEMKQALQMFWARQYDLVLIDVEGAAAVAEAEDLCSAIKTAQPEQLVAFVCNGRVAILTDCPDEILRTEFNPEAFVSGVRSLVAERTAG